MDVISECSKELFKNSERKFLVTKFEFGWSFSVSLEGDCHEIEVPPNLEMLVNLGMSLGGSLS
jgi:hypothetical protein